MDRKFAHDADMHGYGAGCRRNRIGKCCPGDIFLQGAVELDDFGIDECQHPRVEHKVKYVQVGKKDLVEKPGKIPKKTQPMDNQAEPYPGSKQKAVVQCRHYQAGRNAQRNMKRSNLPEKSTQYRTMIRKVKMKEPIAVCICE